MTYEQKQILELYKIFFNEEYPIFGKQEEKEFAHRNLQNLLYLLQLYGINIGDFGYSWQCLASQECVPADSN